MDGKIEELYLSELHRRRRSEEQESLSSFGSGEEEELGTVIAVVTEPTGGIREVSDEFRPELGMPERYLRQLQQKRAEQEDPDRPESHNSAVEELNLKELYQKHIEEDSEAASSIEELANRVAEGETIRLVCFEKPPKWCHRYTLVDAIQQRAEELCDT